MPSKRCKETTHNHGHEALHLQPLPAHHRGCDDVLRLTHIPMKDIEPHGQAMVTKHDHLALQRIRRCIECQAHSCLSAPPHASALSHAPWLLAFPTHSFESASPRSSSSSLPFAAATVAAALSASFFFSFLSFLCLRGDGTTRLMRWIGMCQRWGHEEI